MRKNTAILMLISAFAMFFVSCENSNKKQYEVIPDGASVLVKANLGNVVNESEILEVSMVRTALDFLVNTMPKESRDMFREIITDPTKSGIDVNEPIVMSVAVHPVEVVVSMAMSDKNRFVEVFEAVADGTGVELVEENGITKVDLGYAGNNEFDIAFDSEVLVMVFCESGSADAGYYMTLDKGRQAVNNDKYTEFFASLSDASAFLDFTSIMDAASNLRYMSEEEKALMEMYASYDLSFVMDLDFEDGYSEVATKVFAADEYIKKIEACWMKPDGRFLGFVPYDAVGVLNIATDFGKACEAYPEYMQELLPMIQELGFTEEMLKSFAGDIMFAVLQPEKLGSKELPQMMFAVECEGRDAFDAFIALLADEDLSLVDNDVYALGLNRYYDRSSGEFVSGGYDYYLMYKDDAIFVLPENIYSEVVVDGELKALDRNVADNDCFAALEKSGFVGDFKAIVSLYKDMVTRISPDDKIVLNVLGIFENVEFVMENATETNLRINMVDKDENFLKQILDEVMAIASSVAMGGF